VTQTVDVSNLEQAQWRSLQLHALRETLVDENRREFARYVDEMKSEVFKQGLSEILILAVCRNQKWAVDVLLTNSFCSPNFKNGLALQEASKDKNTQMIELLYPLCDAQLTLDTMKLLDAHTCMKRWKVITQKCS
jgi:hypothetical protein